jgi:hypothetical protein
MVPHGPHAAEPDRDYHAAMARSPVLLLALLAAVPALAQGPLEPSGRLPPVGSTVPRDDPGKPPRKAAPVEAPAAPLPRGAVLEQLSGVVREVDRKEHQVTVETTGGERVKLAMDRNTMVYTSAGLGTVLDVTPGAQVRAGRNAEFVAYWVQVRPVTGKGTAEPSPTPGQGTGPAGGGSAPAAEPRGGASPGTGGPPTPAPAGPGAGPPRARRF